jgi:hypothetical protein
MSSKTDDIVKYFGGETLPSYADPQCDVGGLDDERDLLTPPWLTLTHGQSDVVGQGKAKEGQWYSQAHDMQLGDEKTKPQFVVLGQSVEYVRFFDLSKDGKTGLDWRTDNEAEARKLGGDEWWKTRGLNFLVYGPLNIKDVSPEVVIYAARGKNFKPARAWYREIYKNPNTKGVQGYCKVYEFGAVKEMNPKIHYIFRPRFICFLTDQAKDLIGPMVEEYRGSKMSMPSEGDTVKPEQVSSDDLPF